MSDPDLGGDGGLHRLDASAPPQWRVQAAGNEPVQARWHRAAIRTGCWRFYVADRPGLRLSWAGGGLAYDPGAVTVIPAWLPFTFFITPGVVHGFLHVEVPALGQVLTSSLWPAPWTWRDQAVLARLRALVRALPGAAGRDPLLALEAHALAGLGLAEAYRRLDPAGRARALPADGDRLAPVLAHIEANLERPLAVAALGRLAGLGPEAFIRRFRATYAQTPVQHILERRCARAAALLADSDLDLDAVAARCGFPSRQYLSRMFARRHGLPPAAWRRQQRG